MPIIGSRFGKMINITTWTSLESGSGQHVERFTSCSMVISNGTHVKESPGEDGLFRETVAESF